MGIKTGVIQRTELVRSGGIFAVLLFIWSFIAILSPQAAAVTPISQSYTTEKDIPIGSLVSLKKNSSDQVVPATTENADNLFGVVINKAGSLLSISGTTGKQVQVATGGNEPVFVSDINGVIKQGDPITASPIEGVGMRASDNIRIIGLAQSDATAGQTQKYKDKQGKESSVKVSQIPILVNVSYFFKEPEKTLVPAAIQNIANGIAGKKVDSLPVIISAGIFIIMLIVVMSIIYSMIRSSIISVGRNPMSQGAIYRDLVQLSALVFGILTVGLVAIYMVLTRL